MKPRNTVKRPGITTPSLSKGTKKSARERLAQKRESVKALEQLVLGNESDVIDHLLSSKKSSELDSSLPKEQPAWQDEDDDDQLVKVTKFPKHSHLHHGGAKKLQGSDYAESLQKKHAQVSGPKPSWAKLRWETKQPSDAGEQEDILTTTSSFITQSIHLPRGTVDMKRCPHVNQEEPAKCKLRCLEFHPSAQVILTAGTDQTLRLFQVDGRQNAKIQSVFLDGFPVLCAHFTRDGEQVVMASKHRSFYYYDMIAGKVVNVPRIKGLEESRMKEFSMSPDGKYIVFLGKYGHMHIISAQSKEWITTLKQNGEVSSVAFTADGGTMYSSGSEGEIYVWDLSSRQCVHKFVDDGCVNGTALAISPSGQYLAAGSYSGIVNVYERSALSATRPQPLKAVGNLTTPCTHATFNASSEMLVLASNYTDSALKMLHLPSLSVFSNFPTKADQLHIPQSIAFSLNGGYFAMGNHQGEALLYRVAHYSNY